MRFQILPVAAAALAALFTPAVAPAQSADEPLRYNVVLLDGANAKKIANDHARRFGVAVEHVFEHALKGYGGLIPPSQLAAIETEPAVQFLDFDDEELPQIRPKPAPVPQPAQSVSFGVSRINGEDSSAVSGDGRGSVGVNVAVIDTGVQPDHPDLNVVGGHNCLDGKPKDWSDHDTLGGHGTLVSGFIGALDNAIGRVGVAPGARIWALRALEGDTGFGTTGQLICALDWIAGTRRDGIKHNDIQVANMSLGGPELDDGNCGLTLGVAFHRAICGLTALGVTSVVAAGNETVDFFDQGPASFSEVLTVTAMADRDGMPGSQGGLLQCLLAIGEEQNDDEFAFFSNYATLLSDRAHTVSAPGACIGSTFPGSLYAVPLGGTSFAAPFGSGVVVLCIWSGECAGLTPAQIIAKIVADAAAYNQADPDYGYLGDPQHPVPGRYYGYLLNAALY